MARLNHTLTLTTVTVLTCYSSSFAKHSIPTVPEVQQPDLSALVPIFIKAIFPVTYNFA